MKRRSRAFRIISGLGVGGVVLRRYAALKCNRHPSFGKLGVATRCPTLPHAALPAAEVGLCGIQGTFRASTEAALPQVRQEDSLLPRSRVPRLPTNVLPWRRCHGHDRHARASLPCSTALTHHCSIPCSSVVPLGSIVEASREDGRACWLIGPSSRCQDTPRRPLQPVGPEPLLSGYLMDQHRSSGDYHSTI